MDTARRDDVVFTLTTPAGTQPSSTIILRFASPPSWAALTPRVGDAFGVRGDLIALGYTAWHGQEVVLRGEDDLRMAYALAASSGAGRQLRFTVFAVSGPRARHPANKPLPQVPLLSGTPRAVPAYFTCGICLESGELGAIDIDGCGHLFCRDCVRQYVRIKLEERRFPITCPLCAIDSDLLMNGGEIGSSMLDAIGLDEYEYAMFLELELSVHSVLVTCTGCTRSVFVDRAEYNSQSILACPLPNCNYAWCKQCNKSVPPGGPQHVCGDGSAELRRLMSEQGWMDCPGCKTPVSRMDGCNHMTCVSPGCNSHFCYKCGTLITRSVKEKAIAKAKTAHYKTCEMFPARRSPFNAMQRVEPLPYDLNALRALRAAPIGGQRRWWRFWLG